MHHKIKNLIAVLGKNNISAYFVRSRRDAFEKVMSILPEGSVVGLGDSLTLKQIGVIDALEGGPYTFLNPWKPGVTSEENIEIKKKALTADVFVTGTNAVTLDGKIVNVDGHGNRTAAMLFGPGKVIIVIGINKIVEDVDEAIEKIKHKTAPQNVKRHPHFDPVPPCGTTGECSDCDSPWRICNKTTIIERQFNNERYGPVITMVIVGEELGI